MDNEHANNDDVIESNEHFESTNQVYFRSVLSKIENFKKHASKVIEAHNFRREQITSSMYV